MSADQSSVPGAGGRVKQQAFDCAPRRYAASQQACGEHACIVGDQQIAMSQEAREIAHSRMAELAEGAVEDEQSGLSARKGILRDQLGRQIEIKLVRAHSAPGSHSVPRSQHPIVSSTARRNEDGQAACLR